ncbi:endonuclease VII [Ralstonia phage RSB3]|uniref:Putative endonuclease n=1 Tax=Ralstonia phage RSB3 TaxID=1402875 RepID=U3TK81_9CAUD|nr:endonuclease VII [Ralstonia phage RSB3]BAN92338.1 putative endonuclease [Ralstonia phage RSB3]
MRKLSRAMMPAWKRRQLMIAQGGNCAICGNPVDLTIDREGVVDHNHDTGEIRGVLHRSCNSAEGKIANAAGSWGAKDMSYPAIIEYLRKLLAYYDRPGCGLIYPTHVDAATAKRKAMDKRNLAAKQRRAQQKAARSMRDQREAT